jgi:RHS repeat-associated protein
VRGANLLRANTLTGAAYYLYNGHGDVTGLTDGAGALVWLYDYDAFGNEREIAGQAPSADANPFRYAGEYFDAESGAYYLRARYYDPRNGRWTQEDPAQAGLNWYTYCSNNPVNRIDPWGLVDVDVEEYYKTYDGATIRYSQNESTKDGIWITYNGVELFFSFYDRTDRKYIFDDSLFVTAFGIGTNGIVVFNCATTGNVSIRAAFNIGGAEADTAIEGTTYRALFLDGVKEWWEDVPSKNVSVYAAESSKGIKVSIISGGGTSTTSYPFWGWSPSNVGSMTLDIRSRDGSGNLKTGSDFKWTAAHEFGHTLGLASPWYHFNGGNFGSDMMGVRGAGVTDDLINLVLKAQKKKSTQWK